MARSQRGVTAPAPVDRKSPRSRSSSRGRDKAKTPALDVNVSDENARENTRRSRSSSRAFSGKNVTKFTMSSNDTHNNVSMKKKQAGAGMTIWWLVLTVVTIFFRFEQQVRQSIFALESVPNPALDVIVQWFRETSPNSSSSWIKLMQGTSTVSAVCVGIGYYTFKIPFRVEQGSMARQLFRNSNYPFPLWTFYCLDIAIHVIVVGLMTFYWWKHVDSLSAFIAWCYHRMWSWVHSRGETVFFTNVEEVYGFERTMPLYSYILLYASETLIIATAFYQSHKAYAT